ncbi:MAG: leucyl/phenylalanyl-tRNA--protein transferase [Henriciella sp.]
MSDRFDTTDLLNCYRRGVFPMADSREDMRLFLMDPDLRGVLPLERFHIPRRLRKTVRQDPFRVTVDTAFNRVIEACAEPHPTRPATWINDPILNLYGALHRKGYAHSVECWTEEGALVGGLYGVALGGAFFGESMFSRATDASKVALVHLVARLKIGGFELLDAQFHNPHLEQFGLEEISRDEFRAKLWRALRVSADFYSAGSRGLSTDGSTSLQAITQIS